MPYTGTAHLYFWYYVANDYMASPNSWWQHQFLSWESGIAVLPNFTRFCGITVLWIIKYLLQLTDLHTGPHTSPLHLCYGIHESHSVHIWSHNINGCPEAVPTFICYRKILSHMVYICSEIYTILVPATCCLISHTRILYKLFMIHM